MEITDVYALMLSELQANRLEVVLIPSRIPECAANGGMIRAVTSQNVEWYQHLCACFPRNTHRKKPSTRVCRRDIEVTLKRLASGKTSCSQYAEHLKDVATAYLESWSFDKYEVQFFIEYGEPPAPFDDQF